VKKIHFKFLVISRWKNDKKTGQKRKKNRTGEVVIDALALGRCATAPRSMHPTAARSGSLLVF